MTKKYCIALDQGTTSSRTILFDQKANIVCVSQKGFKQIFPKSGWVEHDPIELLNSQLYTLNDVLKRSKVSTDQIVSIGITNQRETTVLWDKNTGKPVYNAIVWQDKRTKSICNSLKKSGLEDYIKQNTGLVIDSYFSGTKIKWILDNVPKAKELLENDSLLFGTIDSWLLWNLSENNVHATDYSNASRTLLFNIKTLKWDSTLIKELDIPRSILPKVNPSSYHFGNYLIDGKRIPISGIAGDQQAALFGQTCLNPGEVKNTYGTGCFMLMNTGEKPITSTSGLLTTIAWGIDNKVYYALEGSIFIAGAAIEWLKDGLEIIKSAKESDSLAQSCKEDINPVYVVPAFAGLGAPYWDMDAKGAIFGLTRDTGKSYLIRATLEALAYQTKDLIGAMEKEGGVCLSKLKVDGGVTANNFLMQFQSDLLKTEIARPKITESTALGAAYLAGLSVGFWSLDDLRKNENIERVFSPNKSDDWIKKSYSGWKKAVNRTLKWDSE